MEGAVSTTPVTPGPGQPQIPLTPDALAAYKALYDQYESSIESTTDPVLLQKLNDSQMAVANVINLNDQYIIAQNTDAFQALLKQINRTNDGLSDLQTQIKKIASNIDLYAGILSGITKVLSLVPGI
jgi:hypothetical protein